MGRRSRWVETRTTDADCSLLNHAPREPFHRSGAAVRRRFLPADYGDIGEPSAPGDHLDDSG